MENNKKIHIHFHSDCSFFAGCENMLANFFNDSDFRNRFGISFTYRESVEYAKGFKNRVTQNINAIPLNLLDVGAVFCKAKTIKIILLKYFVLILLRITAIPLKWLFIFINTIKLYYVFRKLDFDILHINNGGYPGAYSAISSVFAAKLCKKQNIIYVANNIIDPYKTIYRISDYLIDRLVKTYVKLFITGSKYSGSELKRVLNLRESQLINIYNGISKRNLIETKEDVLKRLNIDCKDKLILGVVARLEKRKGHIYLLKALEKIGQNKVVLLIEGEGPEYDYLLNYINSNSLSHIHLIGNEKNVFDFINAIDIMVLPSIDKEDFPNVILEGMSLGKPVIATKVAGIPEQIINKETGFLLEPKNIDGLVDAINKFINNKNLIKEFGDRGREVFIAKFRKEKALEKYIKLYLDFFA